MTLKNVLTKAGLTAAALFLAGAAVARADQIIPAAAETPGSGGSYWDTTVQLYHPGNAPSVATFTLHKSGGQGTFETDYTIQPGETVTLEKILTRMGTTGSGAITIDADVDFIGEARIYNDEGEDGTQGQQFPIYNEEEILSAGDAGTVMLGADISKFRSNFGWYQHTPGTVKHDLIDQNGDLVTSVTKEYAAHRHEQDEAGKYFNTALGDNWRIQTTVESGSGIGYGSVIDNNSQDPTTKQMHEVATGSSGEYDISVWIHIIDNGQGYEQTNIISEEIARKVWQTGDLSPLIGTTRYVCNENPGGVVDTLPEVISNYNGMTAEEQEEFSGGRNFFGPFVNDSDNDGLPCDPDEPDHQYVNIIDLTITPE